MTAYTIKNDFSFPYASTVRFKYPAKGGRKAVSAAALRARKTLKYHASNLKITNDVEAKNYLDREYRSGWKPEDM